LQVERFLEASAEASPGKIALVCAGRRLTYREIDEAANRVAHGLQHTGLRRGDRVVIYLPKTVEAVIGVFGILKAGGVFVIVNSSTKANKLAYILNNCRAAALVTDLRSQGIIDELIQRTPHTHSVFVSGLVAETVLADGKRLLSLERCLHEGEATKPDICSIDIDLAALVYISGSTGVPKGVALSHLNIVSAATSITSYLENTADDVVLNVLPISFDYGLYQVLMTFRFGGTLVLEQAMTYPHALLETMMVEGVTGLPIVPTISALLLQLDLSSYDFSRLRYVTNTAAALPTRHIHELRRLMPHVKVFSMYGLTECKRVSFLPPDQLDRRPTSVGRAMPNEEIAIVDEAGVRLTSGTGELVVRGSNVMTGYWELPEETARMIRPGANPDEVWLYSGDLFEMDEEGYLYFVGRKDDIIKTRGEKVSPREVENVLYELPDVTGAAVVGVSDDVLGQAIKAFVTLMPGSTLRGDDIRRHCAQRLENFMVPKFVDVCASLPETSTGKIRKTFLRSSQQPGVVLQ
jgi:long-chain acyl-CoA synthetase